MSVRMGPVLYEHKEACCGCAACSSICPVTAITMMPDQEGFLYPHINKEICIGCYKCKTVCSFQLEQKPEDKKTLHTGVNKNIILVNWSEEKEWKFRDYLENATSLTWGIVKRKRKISHKNIIGNLKRYFDYFSVPYSILLKRKEYDNIIAFQQFYGISLSFFLRLFRCKKTFRLYIMSYIYIPKGSGLIRKIYQKFMEYSAGSKYIDTLICNTKVEIELYKNQLSLDTDKLKFIPFGIRDGRDQFSIEDQGYFLCVGRSNRDYHYIVDELAGTDIQLKILCDTLNPAKYNLTENIEVFNNVFGNEYLEMLSKCTGLIVILDKPDVSSGQLSFLKAMQFGKPVIINRCSACEDYIVDQENAIVIEKEHGKLKETCRRLQNDQKLYQHLAEKSRRSYEMNFTDKRLADDLGKLIISNNDSGGQL